MRLSIVLAAGIALAATSAQAQEADNAATPAAPENQQVEPVSGSDVMVANEVMIPPGEAATVAPVGTVEPISTDTPPAERRDDGRFPWGLLGLLGLIGLLGRNRHRAS